MKELFRVMRKVKPTPKLKISSRLQTKNLDLILKHEIDITKDMNLEDTEKIMNTPPQQIKKT